MSLSNFSTSTVAGLGTSPLTLISSGSISTQSALNLSSVLSNTYKFYQFQFLGNVSSTSVFYYLRFRENTTDYSSANYKAASAELDSTGATSNWSSGSGKNTILLGRSGTEQARLDIKIYRPSATEGQFTFLTVDYPNAAHVYGMAYNTSMTNFNGFSIYPNSGTLTGSYSLWGYN